MKERAPQEEPVEQIDRSEYLEAMIMMAQYHLKQYQQYIQLVNEVENQETLGRGLKFTKQGNTYRATPFVKQMGFKTGERNGKEG